MFGITERERKLRRLLSGVCLGAALTMIVGCSGPEERKAEHLQRAKMYFDQGKLKKASVEIKNVLQIDPKTAEAYWIYAHVNEKEESYREAFAALNKVVELDPDHIEARIKLGQIYIAAAGLDKAREMVEHIVRLTPENPTARIMTAQILAREGNVEGALKEVEAVFDKDVSQVDAARLIAVIYANQGKLDRAEKTLQSTMAANPQHVGVRLTLAEVLLKGERYSDTESVLKEIIVIEPDQWLHRSRLAALYTRLDRLDDAERVLRDAVGDNDSEPERILALIAFLFKQHGAPAAEKELLSWINKHPDIYEYRFALGELYIKTKNWESARGTYQAVIQLDEERVESIAAKNKLAELYFARGDLVNAQEYVEQVLVRSPGNIGALLTRGKLALANKDYPNAVSDFRAASRELSQSGEVLGLLAQAHILNGERDLALSSLKQAVAASPRNSDLRIKYVEMLVAVNDYSAALEQLKELLELSPTHLKAMEHKVALHALRQQWDEAEESIQRIRDVYPNSTVADFEMGKIYAVRKDYKRAEAKFKTVMSRTPNDREVLRALVKTYLAQGKLGDATKLVESRVDAEPDVEQYYNMLGEIYLAEKSRYRDAEQSFRKAIQLNSEWTLPYINIGRRYRLENDLESAISAYEEGLRAVPDDLVLMLALATANEELGRTSQAIRLYEAILEKNPQHVIARNNLAFVLTKAADGKESLDRALNLSRDFESLQNPLLLDTLGWVHYHRGEFDQAVLVLKHADEKAKAFPIVKYHLGMAYYRQGERDLAKAYLKKALEDNPTFEGVAQAKEILAGLETN